MSLYVRYDTVREPAAKPAAQERCTITDAVRKAVQDELDRHAFEHDERWRVLREIQAEIAKLPELRPGVSRTRTSTTRTACRCSDDRRRHLRRRRHPARRARADEIAKLIEDNDSLISAGSTTELTAVMVA